MKGIKILGALGSRAENANTTCIQVSKNTLIDAGNIIQGLGDDARYINNIFFTHSHLDHIIDCAFLIDNFFISRDKPLNIYALPETIEVLKKNFFNSDVWPDFTTINLNNKKIPSLKYIPIIYGKEYKVEDNISLTPIKSVHTVPTCGYIIKNQNHSILFSGDTFKNPDLWDLVNTDGSIKTVIIDVSFPNELSNIAMQSKHLTPNFLDEDMSALSRNDVHIYINHIKPFHKDKVIDELEKIGIMRNDILNGGEIILYTSECITKQNTSTIEKINKLNRIGTSLSAEDDIDKLLESIVKEAKILTNADGATLYISDSDSLHFSIIQTDSLNINISQKNKEMAWPPIPLYTKDKKPNTQMVASVCALENKIINIPNIYKSKDFSFEGAKQFDKKNNYKTKSMLVIPLINNGREVIGVLQLINKQNHFYDSIDTFNSDDENFALSLASQAAVAISNIKLVKGLEKLLNSFLESIIYAISRKSAHTAGHIRRMVKLSLMIADAVDKDKDTFKDKTYSKEEIEQINFAALVHDIGKLSIPEYILDKSTKLETVYDRLELIQGRITYIKKSLEVEYLKGLMSKKKFSVELEKLKTYSLLVEKYNIGKEYLPNADIEKIKEMQKKSYVFDENIHNILTDDEAENLSIQKGTITDKERDIINSHASISLAILNKLPFPKKYKRIPEISANHHEKINGKGYPQGLKGDQISFEARILAIADIFEALTASDRPYKKANTLSTAMNILYLMAQRNELDRDLVKFFYTSKLYLKYAQELLPERSIDEVNIDFDTL